MKGIQVSSSTVNNHHVVQPRDSCNKFQAAHADMRQLNASSDLSPRQINGHLPQILNMLIVALFSLMKTPLLICLNLKSWRTLRTLGATWLIPRIRMQKASFGSEGTWKFPSFLASLFNLDIIYCRY